MTALDALRFRIACDQNRPVFSITAKALLRGIVVPLVGALAAIFLRAAEGPLLAQLTTTRQAESESGAVVRDIRVLPII